MLSPIAVRIEAVFPKAGIGRAVLFAKSANKNLRNGIARKKTATHTILVTFSHGQL